MVADAVWNGKNQYVGGIRAMVNRYIVGPIGQMYMDEVTTDDLRLLMVPLSKGSSGMYGQLNMLIKNIFNSARREQGD